MAIDRRLDSISAPGRVTDTLRIDQPMPQGEHQRLLARGSAELLARTAQMRRDRGHADTELAADATDTEPPAQPFEAFDLAGRQAERTGRVEQSCLPALHRHVASSARELIGATLMHCPTLTAPAYAPPASGSSMLEFGAWLRRDEAI